MSAAIKAAQENQLHFILSNNIFTHDKSDYFASFISFTTCKLKVGLEDS